MTVMTAANKPDEAEATKRAHEIYRKVLLMVRVLHQRGYEQLRISPGMSRSGMHWRCSVTSAMNIKSENGAWLARYNEELVWFYTSANQDAYFNQRPEPDATPAELADEFVQLFPNISASAKCGDAAYIRWYEEMLRLTEPDLFPIAFADWRLPQDKLKTVGGRRTDEVFIPLPPPGLANTIAE